MRGNPSYKTMQDELDQKAAPSDPGFVAYLQEKVEQERISLNITPEAQDAWLEQERADQFERERQAAEIQKDNDWLWPAVVTWAEAMEQRERDFNRRYYNNPDGKPEWRYG